MAPIALGLMSGTSCDGISAALVRFSGRTLHVLAHRTLPYPKRLSSTLLRAKELPAPALSSLNMELGERFANVAKQLLRTSHCSPRKVAVIGSHGHTIYHGPTDRIPSTLQLGEPAVIAERTGIPVVSNFRTRDIAAGGEGAPLIPYFDQAFFGRGAPCALLNIGGIANVAIVGRGLKAIAFDTGPGNCLIDIMAKRVSRGRLQYDRAGSIARSRKIDHNVVARLWKHPYFSRKPPKSTGREIFNELLIERSGRFHPRHSQWDVLATFTYFTAWSIAQSIKRFVPHRLCEVIVSGGGTRNKTLMEHLSTLIMHVPVRLIEDYGIPAQAKEPLAFAYLALRTIRGKVNHLPETTGAEHARILGTLTPG